MMRVVTFKWKPRQAYRSVHTGAQVNVLRNMVRRHYKTPHEFVCITDDPTGIDSDIRIVPLWDEFRDIPSPHGRGNPACYVRLPIFSERMAEVIGPRFVALDLDMVITQDARPVWDVDDDFKIWGDTARGTPYNGSMILMTAGARSVVYESFDPVESPRRARALGYIGSDQAWIGACLGRGESKWTRADGVYSYRNEISRMNRGLLPRDARIVIFHGHVDPWQPTTQARHRWVKDNYR